VIAKVVRNEKNRIISYAITGDIENSTEEHFDSIEQLKEQFKADQEDIQAEIEN